MVLEMPLCNAESSSFMAERKRKRRNGEHNALCNNNDRSQNCPEDTSFAQEIPLERDSHVESTVSISPESGLIEALSNSNSNCLKKKNKKRKKKMMINAPKTDNTDVDLQGVTSDAMTAPFRTETPVDVSMKKVSEISSFEVDVSVDTGTRKDFVATPVKVGSIFNNNNNDDTSHDCPEGASSMQDIPLGRDSYVEAMVKIGSESGLMEAQSNSNMDCLHNEKKKRRPKKKKRLNAPKTDDIDANLQEVTSETITAPLLAEASVDVSIKKVPETAPSKVVQDIPQGRDSYVKSVVKIDSESGLMEAQSNSNLDCFHNEKKKKRLKKKKKLNAPIIDYIDVNIKEVTSESITAPLRTEASVDVSIKKVPKTATGEVDIMCDTSKKMELVATPVKIGSSVDMSAMVCFPVNMSRAKRKRMRKKKQKESLNDSVSTDNFAERDSSLQPPVNICTSNVSVEKQPNEDISLCMEKNERNKRDDGGKASENYSPANRQMANSEHFGKEDVKIAPEELDLASIKGDLPLSRNQSGSLRSTTLLEKHDLSSENDIVSGERSDAKTHHRKRKRKSFKSSVNSSDCIMDGRRDTLFDHSEEAHTVDLIENKLDRVIEVENAAPAHVLRDIGMREASVNGLEGQPACKDSEKKMKMKNLRKDVTENSLMKNVSVLLEGHHEEKSIEKAGEIQITVQNASCKDGGSVERSGSKEKTSDNISDHDTFCNHLKQKNVKLETKTKEIAPSSHLVVIKDDSSVKETNKEESHQHSSHSVPVRACIGHSKKKLLVLDVNGILAAITQHPARKGWKPDYVAACKAVFKRPHCRDFLQFCFERFNVGIWTSRIKKNVERAVKFLLGDFKHRLVFCWDASHCSKTGLTAIENKNKPLVLKELRKLWEKAECGLPWRKGEYNETNTLLVDDSPYKALRNPAYTAIFPYSYQYWDTKDKSLGPGGDLREYLERLSHTENVQEFVRQNPFGQPPINESNPHWSYYSQVLCTKSSLSHNVGNASLVNTDEDHKISQQTRPQIVSDPQ